MSLASYARKNLELIIAFVAVAIAIATVIVAFYEASLMREQARLSVKPSVWLKSNTRTLSQSDENGEFQLVITNKGLGPATLEYLTIQHQGEYLHFWQEWLSHAPLDSDYEKRIAGTSTSSAPQKYVLSDGEELPFFSITAPSDLIRKVSSASEQYEFTICACSFYNECWISAGLNTAPEVVSECKIDPVNQFQGTK